MANVSLDGFIPVANSSEGEIYNPQTFVTMTGFYPLAAAGATTIKVLTQGSLLCVIDGKITGVKLL